MKIANKTPIMGCRYINTATSVEDNLLKAYALNRYVINVVQITTYIIGRIACCNGRLAHSTFKNWLIPNGKLKTNPMRKSHLSRVIKSYFSAIGLTIIK